MLCVRDGAFRVEYRVLLDEKRCGGPRTVATPFCGVSYVCVSQQPHGETVLCVRDGPFRIEYRVVLLDEKPCCA